MYPQSEDQKELLLHVKDLARDLIAPRAAEIDRECRFPHENIALLRKEKLMGMYFPEEWGGRGTDYLSYIMAIEEISKACASTGVILATHSSLASWPIYAYGSPEQKEKYLRPLATGDKLGAFCLTETNAGSDAASQESVASFTGEHYILDGHKMFITNGGPADIHIVFAMTDKSKGLKGISAFIVEKDTPGFEIEGYEEKLGIRGSTAARLRFTLCRIPKENLLGEEGQGFKIAMQTLDGGRIGIGAQALGIAQASLDAALSYALKRHQFGAAIASNQAISFMLADMERSIQGARHLVYHAAVLRGKREKHSKEAAMAKLSASESAVWCALQAIQIHGGHGYTTSYPVERHLRDAKITEIYEGTSQIQKMVIAGHLLREGAV